MSNLFYSNVADFHQVLSRQLFLHIGFLFYRNHKGIYNRLYNQHYELGSWAAILVFIHHRGLL
jgi:hypothetical protein